MNDDVNGIDSRAPQERILTVSEVAAMLQVDPETVRRMLRSGRLEGARLGGRKAGWRIAESALWRMLRSGKHLVH